MADRKRQDSMDDGDEVFRTDEVSRTVGSESENERDNGESIGSGRRSGLADRLSEILVEDGEGDLLLQQSDREDNFLQWLQVLDLQIMGACRADERLKPLLKVNASTGAAEDRLLAQLSQHFEASEVGLLARCLCVPLVSMRVGKIVKRGTLLCPTSVRGNLNLTLLPSSDLRITFVGDDGRTQRLATLCDISECSSVEVDEIPADQSGRSFLVKVPDGETFYFWCSEKSKLLGSDLLSKIKDLLKTKPTLAELTGISESRLECFATHLRGYLVGPNVNKAQAGAASLSSTSMDAEPADPALGLNTQSTSISGRPLRARQSGGQSLKGHAQYQGILSPRSSLFKEGGPRPLSSFRNASKERLRRRGDTCLPAVDGSFVTDAVVNLSENGKQLEVSGSMSSPLSFLESLGEKYPSPTPSTSSQFPPINSLFSPYYCWCPPCTFPITSVPQLPSLSTEPFSLPALPSFLAATGPPTLCTQIPPLDLAAIPPLEFPTLVSDPLSRLPFSKQSSQQIPTFVPLMCDPIVHIPIVDVCSSGQGYLVSAGPALATNIPPLHPKLVGPMMPESESIVEKGARETLRLLIANSGSQPSASLMDVLPAVLNEDKKGIVVAGSRGLYSGTSDVGAIVSSFASVGLSSISERPMTVKGCGGSSDVLEQTSGGLDLQDPSFMSEEKNDW